MPDLNTQNFYWLPLLKDEIWDELQRRNYQMAGENLKVALKAIPPTDWEDTFWVGILKGFPMLRAGLSEKEWRENVLPTVAKAVLETASGEALANIFKNLDIYPETFKDFRDLLISAVPGENQESKLSWLKTRTSSLYVFLIGNLAQEVGVGFIELKNSIPVEKTVQRYGPLPQELKNEILSYASAEDIFRIGSNNHFSPEKISLLGLVTGRALMGFLHTDDVQKELQEMLLIDNRIANSIYQELDRKILSRLKNEIREIYDPIVSPVKPAPGETREEKIALEKLGEERPAVRVGVEKEEQPFDITQGKPLIIHKEERQEPATEEKKFKGFDFPFGIFDKEKGKAATSEPIRVRVEGPGGGPASAKATAGKEKRVVHYSEYRTPLTPFGRPEEEIIDLPSLTKREPPPKTTPPKAETPKPPEQKIPEPKPNKGPSIEGNIVDLKNL